MKQCLVDSSSAILLYKCGLFLNLIGKYRVLMASSVFQELTVFGYPGAAEFAEHGANGTVLVIQPPPESSAVTLADDRLVALDRGERDTIQVSADFEPGIFIITDDGPAAQYCRSNDIPYINALLCARILLLTGMLSEHDFQQAWAKLTSIGRYSERIMDYARQCSTKEIAFFLP